MRTFVENLVYYFNTETIYISLAVYYGPRYNTAVIGKLAISHQKGDRYIFSNLWLHFIRHFCTGANLFIIIQFQFNFKNRKQF